VLLAGTVPLHSADPLSAKLHVALMNHVLDEWCTLAPHRKYD